MKPITKEWLDEICDLDCEDLSIGMTERSAERHCADFINLVIIARAALAQRENAERIMQASDGMKSVAWCVVRNVLDECLSGIGPKGEK